MNYVDRGHSSLWSGVRTQQSSTAALCASRILKPLLLHLVYLICMNILCAKGKTLNLHNGNIFFLELY